MCRGERKGDGVRKEAAAPFPSTLNILRLLSLSLSPRMLKSVWATQRTGASQPKSRHAVIFCHLASEVAHPLSPTCSWSVSGCWGRPQRPHPSVSAHHPDRSLDHVTGWRRQGHPEEDRPHFGSRRPLGGGQSRRYGKKIRATAPEKTQHTTNRVGLVTNMELYLYQFHLYLFVVTHQSPNRILTTVPIRQSTPL